jgi:hypothetical protein
LAPRYWKDLPAPVMFAATMLTSFALCSSVTSESLTTFSLSAMSAVLPDCVMAPPADRS